MYFYMQDYNNSGGLLIHNNNNDNDNGYTIKYIKGHRMR